MGKRALMAVHRDLEEGGRRALLSWVSHPLVQATVTALRPAAEQAVSPLSEHLSDPQDVTLLAACALDLTGRDANGLEWPHPLEAWELSEGERSAFAQVTLAFLEVLVGCAQLLATNGVMLDPVAKENLLVLAQLLLLDVDFRLAPEQLIDALNVLPSGGVSRDGTAVVTSRHATDEAIRDLLIVQRAYRNNMGQGQIPVPYAGGKKRRPARTSNAQMRRAALRSVLETFPACTTQQLVTGWHGNPTTPGGLLRVKLGQRQDATPPSRSALYKDLAALRP